MKKELQEELFNKFPVIFQDKDKGVHESCTGWGICVGDGWFDLIKNACKLIQWHIDQAKESVDRYNTSEVYRNNHIKYGWKVPELIPDVVARQVKEKFGGLRFYYNGGDQYVGGVISMAKSMSYRICEKCGNKGQCNDEGWLITLCDKCRLDRTNKMKNGPWSIDN